MTRSTMGRFPLSTCIHMIIYGNVAVRSFLPKMDWFQGRCTGHHGFLEATIPHVVRRVFSRWAHWDATFLMKEKYRSVDFTLPKTGKNTKILQMLEMCGSCHSCHSFKTTSEFHPICLSQIGFSFTNSPKPSKGHVKKRKPWLKNLKLSTDSQSVHFLIIILGKL